MSDKYFHSYPVVMTPYPSMMVLCHPSASALDQNLRSYTCSGGSSSSSNNRWWRWRRRRGGGQLRLMVVVVVGGGRTICGTAHDAERHQISNALSYRLYNHLHHHNHHHHHHYHYHYPSPCCYPKSRIVVRDTLPWPPRSSWARKIETASSTVEGVGFSPVVVVVVVVVVGWKERRTMSLAYHYY